MSHYYDPHTQKLSHVEDAETALAMGLVPSVTTIMAILKHEHVEAWKRKMAVDYALRNNFKPIKDDIAEAVNYENRTASVFGTICHALLECHLRGEKIPEKIIQMMAEVQENVKLVYAQAMQDYQNELDLQSLCRSFQNKELAPFGIDTRTANLARKRKAPREPKLRKIDFQACVEPAKRWIDANIKEVIFSERSFVDKALGYAGTIDVLGRMKNGRLLLFDFKFKKHSSRFPIKADAEYRYQLSAYRRAMANILGIDFKEIWTGNLLCASQENDYYEGPFCDPWMYEGTDWFESFLACKRLWEEQRQFND